MASQVVAGVDWAGSGWLAVYFKNRSFDGYSFASTFDALWENREPELLLVDVPIGLPEDTASLTARENLDSQARSVTERPSSVFPVPSCEACRMTYEDDASYEEVVTQSEADLDKGLSWQSYYIASGIGEVDAFLRQHDEAEQRIIEAHPEVCFRALLGRPLEYGKTSAPGVGERLTALETLLETPGDTLGTVAKKFQGEPSAIDIDDVLDALVLAATASKGEELDCLPEEWSTDPVGIPMRMAYWGEESLTE
ncbi:DUF429 domain-containing protein [Halobacterium salinarum]|uniref:DUF429 domain-containing protein n=2 Tax=Halobacterium salinarum TaxID=2242 RepID=UPI0025534323|nr:DUF429 domain-containing protein [Halobacterium salinarum]MDL0136857.1 DUF429 domain-containing protein [Halobacterium salinarum]MDL0139447.1 DUF429 domain-containing protein [Halobacterium salinarum]